MSHAYASLLVFCSDVIKVLGGIIKRNPVDPVNPVKKIIVKNGASAHTLIMQNEPKSM